MASILQIDSLGKRYGLLPSEVLKRSDTFDVYVLDVALTYEQYQQRKANNEPPELTQDELLEIFNRNKK